MIAGIMFIGKFVCIILPSERKLVPRHSHLVTILSTSHQSERADILVAVAVKVDFGGWTLLTLDNEPVE